VIIRAIRWTYSVLAWLSLVAVIVQLLGGGGKRTSHDERATFA